VDLDHQGHPIGYSAEQHSDDQTLSLLVGPQPAPFDDPQDAWEACLDMTRERWGFTMALPFGD
jgi:hypothetical protein